MCLSWRLASFWSHSELLKFTLHQRGHSTSRQEAALLNAHVPWSLAKIYLQKVRGGGFCLANNNSWEKGRTMGCYQPTFRAAGRCVYMIAKECGWGIYNPFSFHGSDVLACHIQYITSGHSFSIILVSLISWGNYKRRVSGMNCLPCYCSWSWTIMDSSRSSITFSRFSCLSASLACWFALWHDPDYHSWVLWAFG